MNVEWTDNALAQLKGIHDYIARDSDFFAKRMVDRLTSRSIQIHEHPLSGEMVPEFGDVSVREVIEGPYRMIYRISVPTLFVLAVILDALHVATAAVGGVQFLLTQNCRHIANAHMLPRIYMTLADLGFPKLLIYTPAEFLGNS